MMINNFEDVGRFHRKFGLPFVNGEASVDHWPGPREVDADLLKFRLRFLEEELAEFRSAMPFDEEGMPADHAGMFDALLDLVYVAMGTAHLLGYPWQEGWDAVQAANMAKVRAKADGSDSKRESSWDVVKPPGWTAPDIEAILRRLGFECNVHGAKNCPVCA